MTQAAYKDDKKLFWELLVIGIALTGGGIFALISPIQTFKLLLKALGVIALVTSLAFAVRFVRLRATYGWRSSFSLTLAVFSLLAGLLFLVKPEETSRFLIYIMAIWFIAYAVFALLASFALRYLSRFLFFLALTIGLVLLLSGILILVMPQMIGLSIGLVIGINLLLNGLEFILLALGDRLGNRKRSRTPGPGGGP